MNDLNYLKKQCKQDHDIILAGGHSRVVREGNLSALLPTTTREPLTPSVDRIECGESDILLANNKDLKTDTPGSSGHGS